MKIKISEKLNNLALAFGKDNPLLVVGGCIRNHICKLPYHDIDLSSCLMVDEVQKILPQGYEIKVKNAELNTCEIVCCDEKYEYATFRREIYKSGGEHKPSQINFDATIVEDVSRRDFTCNSLYYEIIKNKLIDFYGGVQDIKQKKLKTVETPEYVMQNDGVRILRMIRFASELNFAIDNETYVAAEKYKDNLKKISKDRIREEFIKIINANLTYPKVDKKNMFNKNRAYNGIKLIDKLDLWRYFSSEEKIENLRGVGAYLNCFVKEKKNPLLAFCVDAYFYLKRLNIITCVKDFELAFMGIKGLNFSKTIKKEIVEVLKALETFDVLKEKGAAEIAAFKEKYAQNQKVLNLLKIRNKTVYNWFIKLI